MIRRTDIIGFDEPQNRIIINIFEIDFSFNNVSLLKYYLFYQSLYEEHLEIIKIYKSLSDCDI